MRINETKCCVALAILGIVCQVSGQQLEQDSTYYNRSSYRGLPLSDETGAPIDQDYVVIDDTGSVTYRAPTIAEQESGNRTTSPPTTGQFRSFVVNGAYLATAQVDSSKNEIKVVNDTGNYRLKTVTVAAPFVARASSYQFGDIIAAPSKNEAGGDIEDPDEYWFRQPYEDDESYGVNQTSLGYYWSPHAEEVFAVQSGNIEISWVKRELASSDPGLFNEKEGSLTRYERIDGSDTYEYINDGNDNFYVLHTETYIISGTANKTPQLVFWNNSDDYNGPDINIDQGVIGDFVFIYTDSFPETVVTGFDDDANTDIEESTIEVDKTGGIWQIKALNYEGRIFAEILGDPKGDGTKEFLGYEIIDVNDVGIPELVQVNLGEPLDTGVDEEPEGGLFPQPVNLVSSLDFTYRQVVDGTDIPILYATTLTKNTGDLEIHWMAEGVEGIRWPYQFSRYQLVWPTNYKDYRHYVRPSSNEEDAAELSSVLIPSEMVPVIEEQDIIDGGGAFIGEDTRFYTIVTEDDPVHRTLLRYNAGDDVAFERVLSWRTDELKSTRETTVDHPVVHLDINYTNGSGEFSNIAKTRYIELNDKTLYLANMESLNESRGQDSVMALDVSDLSSVNELFTIYDTGTLQYSISEPIGIEVQEDILLILASGDNNLYGVNVEDLSSPEYEFRLKDNTSMTNMAGPLSSFLDGDYLYVTAFEGSLGIVDLTSQESLNSITRKLELVPTSTDVNGDEFGFEIPSDVVVVNEIAYVADAGNDTLYVINVSTPLEPDILRKITSQDDGFENLDAPWSMLQEEDELYVACNGSNTVLIISINDPENPEFLTQVEHGVNGYEGLFKTQRMSFADDILVVTGRESEMVTMIDVSSPDSPVLIEEFKDSDYGFEIPADVDFDGELLVIAGESTDNIVLIDWKDPRIKRWDSSDFSGTIAEELDVFDSEYLVFEWEDELKAPRFIEETVYVGDRIKPPSDQDIINPDYEDYLAGYINQSSGTSFNPNAYINPLDNLTSIADSNLGAIIPVNAIPGDNQLEVWWMRENGADEEAGFATVLWPSVIGYYTLEWPDEYDEIVLASGVGTGALSSLIAAGNIYYQNTPGKVGYNPNEEHAIMSGGQAYALRDDLNLTDDLTLDPDGDYSSEPFVLLEYTADDGRPAMNTYRVLREKPEEGLTFKIAVEAALEVIQPPMPLPLLGVPLYEDAESFEETLNREVIGTFIESNSTDGQVPGTITTVAEHALAPGEFYVMEGTETGTDGYLETRGALIDSVTDQHNVLAYIGSSELIPVIHRQFCSWRINGTANNPIEQAEAFEVESRDWGTNGETQILLFSESEGVFSVYTMLDSTDNRLFLRMPDGSTDNGFPEAEYAMILDDSDSLDLSNWLVSRSVIPRADRSSVSDQESFYNGFTFIDRKGGIWAYRGPHDATVGSITGEGFDIQYHYPTQTGFAFPSSSEEIPVGTLTPYLRTLTDNGYLGDPIYVEEYDSGSTQAAPITYLPYWATDVPELKTGKTLTSAFNGIDGIRGNSSAEILYDQSLALNELNASMQSAVLHDPTREKRFYLGEDGNLDEIPTSVETVNYLGDDFFPQLPPHLSERFYYDPNLGDLGALVFKGEFFEHSEDYILPNIVGAGDLEAMQELVDENDEKAVDWYSAIESLSTTMERFVEENGVYVASEDVDGFNYSIGYNEVAYINDDDVAVDSYAITAMGPGTGYVTVITGNGNAFTDSNDPVGMFVFKVVNDLHTGLIVDVPSDNPLSEKLTMQQVVDLSGSSAGDYVFEWKIAAPSGDVAPLIANEDVITSLLGSDGWDHIAFPSVNDDFTSIVGADDRRKTSVSLGTLEILSSLEFGTWNAIEDDGDSETYESEFTLLFDAAHGLEVGELIAFEDGIDTVVYRVDDVTGSNANIEISQFDTDQTGLTDLTDLPLSEFPEVGVADSVIHQSFTTSSDTFVTGLWLGLELSSHLGAEVYINGEKVVSEAMSAIDDAYTDTATTTAPSDSAANNFGSSYYIDPSVLDMGVLDGSEWTHDIVVYLYATETASLDTAHILDLALDMAEYEEIVDEEGWLDLETIRYPDGVRAILGGTADVQALSDNYLIMRYGQVDVNDFDNDGDTSEIIRYSKWTDSILAEGWIKRVLDGINPFDQRVTDLFNNAIETDASILTLAGQRWEGNVALNSDTINDFGLIEIYETVLNRGKGLSIDAGINYGPANDALLLAAGYLNDLYMMLGNEAWADALNPTIGISTADDALGDVATSSFAFQGQSASLLDEELSLLRGRDDFLPPGVEASPVYNRLFWNYTRGIDSGEIIYALNYNIQEDQDDAVDGIIDAEDAQIMYPQGHGDAYGHYLTAIKNYFKLLLDEDFDWVPRTEAVLILGQTVQVDYTDEGKFAAAASSLAEAGAQIVDLTWRQDYESGDDVGWDHFGEDAIRENSTRGTERYWGLDHWSTRVAQGTYINWIVGNSMLEEVDSDETHEGIQIVDRQTVPELEELTFLAESVQQSMDSADAHLNPLGLTEGSVPFDIEPISTFDVDPTGTRTHFEQIYDRAVAALQNAVVAFDGAKDVTALMRSEDDSLAEFQADVDRQELAYKNQLIEIYGTPYADDIGVGATYVSDYDGPDLINYNIVDLNELTIPNWIEPEEDKEFTISALVEMDDPETDANEYLYHENYATIVENDREILNDINNNVDEVTYTINAHGFIDKEEGWGSRESPGQMQSAIGGIILASNDLREALENYGALSYQFQRELELFKASIDTHDDIRSVNLGINLANTGYETAKLVYEILQIYNKKSYELTSQGINMINEGVPKSTILGLANGGDLTSGVRQALEGHNLIALAKKDIKDIFIKSFLLTAEQANSEYNTWVPFNEIAPLEWKETQRQGLFDLEMSLGDVQMSIFNINNKIQKLGAAKSKYSSLVAKGNRIQAEREVFRKRAAAVTQGFRTRDAAFRVFRDEKLERYKSLFDLAARFTFMAAQAYDYETGLLFTDEGKDFIGRIIASRALGVMESGTPQFAGSNTGDPGLSSVLAEMNADWQVLRGRLGHNNPDTDKTTVSLRTENYRILPDEDGDEEWKDVLNAGWMDDLRTDEDLARHCMQLDVFDGLPVPGLVLEFSTTITPGKNLFGNSLVGGDHQFSPISYATKIFSVGVALEGYIGVDDPASNSSTTGSSSVTDPDSWFLDPNALSANPYVYLIPVGVDAMRSPPLGDESVIRTWEVEDLTIPLPFNVGASDFSSKPLYQSSDSLTEDLFGIRKHQAFRAVGSVDAFPDNGRLMSSTYTNTRLIGRSVWNTHWKLVIPAWTLLEDQDRGLEVFIDTVTDIKLNFETLSYSGN